MSVDQEARIWTQLALELLLVQQDVVSRGASCGWLKVQTSRGRPQLWHRLVVALPDTNPLRRIAVGLRRGLKSRSYRSPFQQVASVLSLASLEQLETTHAFALAPWENRLPLRGGLGEESMSQEAAGCHSTLVAVSSSGRNGLVGVGGAARHPPTRTQTSRVETFSFTLGLRTEQSSYSGELAAMAYATRRMLPEIRNQDLILLTSNKAAISSVQQPRLQSGQQYLSSIYDSVRILQERGNTVSVGWIPASEKNDVMLKAKHEAREATKQGASPQKQFPSMRSTVLNQIRAILPIGRRLPDNVGKFSKRIDTALPGKHTKALYDQLTRREAGVLAQLRTGMARLNGYLSRIKAATSDQCACGQATETVEHFLFRCTKWTEQRKEMIECTAAQRGNLSFFLGGRAPSDKQDWTPNMRAVRSAIKFALATGRLDAN